MGSENIVAYHPSTQIEAIAVGYEVFVNPHNTTWYLMPTIKNLMGFWRVNSILWVYNV